MISTLISCSQIKTHLNNTNLNVMVLFRFLGIQINSIVSRRLHHSVRSMMSYFYCLCSVCASNRIAVNDVIFTRPVKSQTNFIPLSTAQRSTTTAEADEYDDDDDDLYKRGRQTKLLETVCTVPYIRLIPWHLFVWRDFNTINFIVLSISDRPFDLSWYNLLFIEFDLGIIVNHI